MSNIVTVSRLSVELLDHGIARVVVEREDKGADVVEVGTATGTRIFNELALVRKALDAALAVLRQDVGATRFVNADEMRLANLLKELDIY